MNLDNRIGIVSMYGYSNLFLIIALCVPFIPKMFMVIFFGLAVLMATFYIF